MFRRWMIGFLLVMAGCKHHATVVHTPNDAAGYGVTVIGKGEAKAKPDIARVQIGVEVRAQTVEQAERQANARMAAIITALKSQNVAEKDIKTSNYSINFEREHPGHPEPKPDHEATSSGPRGGAKEPAGYYRVNNQLQVTIRDLDNVGKVLAEVTRAGANNIWGIQFELEDPSALKAKARKEAVRDARAQAKQLAELNDIKLGDVLAISETGGDTAYPRFAFERMEMKAMAEERVPIEQGEIVVTHQVQLRYAID